VLAVVLAGGWQGKLLYMIAVLRLPHQFMRPARCLPADRSFQGVADATLSPGARVLRGVTDRCWPLPAAAVTVAASRSNLGMILEVVPVPVPKRRRASGR